MQCASGLALDVARSVRAGQCLTALVFCDIQARDGRECVQSTAAQTNLILCKEGSTTNTTSLQDHDKSTNIAAMQFGPLSAKQMGEMDAAGSLGVHRKIVIPSVLLAAARWPDPAVLGDVVRYGIWRSLVSDGGS